jgi:hypothetical protein
MAQDCLPVKMPRNLHCCTGFLDRYDDIESMHEDYVNGERLFSHVF